MDAQELRIGNWIFCKGEPIQVTALGLYGVQSGHNERVGYAKFATPDLEGIPLSPDLLERINFSIFSFAENFTCRAHSGQYGSMVYLQQYGEGEEPLPHIKYLHQLQNLFYALTGHELQYTP